MPTHGEVERCVTCGHIVSRRRITLYVGMVAALKRVLSWCESKGIHEFSRKEIKHLMLNENDSARFGDWVMFGGLVYKRGKGSYGINVERCRAFFRGEYQIPTAVWKDPVSGEITAEDYRTIGRIPKLTEFLNEQGLFIAEYMPAL